MKRMLTTTAAALIALTSLSGVALAQPGPHGPHGPSSYDRHDDHRGPPPSHRAWRKGDRIERNQWRRYQSVDWRRHHLRAPPRGYEWREVNGQYVMAAAATGLVAAIIAANH
jgi:Ni/Co efflux regulator RcnB